MKDAIIGTGFYADTHDLAKYRFFERWLRHVGSELPIVVVDNSRYGFAHSNRNLRVVRIENNLGYVGHFLGRKEPRLLGWSMSWIIPAMFAYSEERDFVYIEQDCLVFGDWYREVCLGSRGKNMDVAFGEAHPEGACEQSLFWIRFEAIPAFVSAYMGLPDGDGVMLPETKFAALEKVVPMVGRLRLRCGRNRPLPIDDKAWYAQHLTEKELDLLESLKLSPRI